MKLTQEQWSALVDWIHYFTNEPDYFNECMARQKVEELLVEQEEQVFCNVCHREGTKEMAGQPCRKILAENEYCGGSYVYPVK